VAQHRRILQLCVDAHVPIIEDDPYRFIRSGQKPSPFLFHLGRLSKLVAPSLRLGFSIAPKKLTYAMQEGRQAGDLQPNAFAQRIVLRYVELGRTQAHPNMVREFYTARRRALTEILTRSGLAVSHTSGGMFAFPRLPANALATNIFTRAIQNVVMFASGSAFAINPDAGGVAHQITLCLAGLDLIDIKDAAGRLIRLLNEV
jgi:2-aminoadipate transaminase